MRTMNTVPPTQIAEDQALIEQLGGPSQLAKLLGFKKPGGVQRIQNWKVRGIPALVKLAHPHIFLSHLKLSKKRAASKPVKESA